MLPGLPTQSEPIPFKLKRELRYQGHHVCDFVYPEKLSWLKATHPWYTDVNFDWFDHALLDDCDLFGGLVGQPEEANNYDSEISNRNLVQDVVQDNTASLDECFTASTTHYLPSSTPALYSRFINTLGVPGRHIARDWST